MPRTKPTRKPRPRRLNPWDAAKDLPVVRGNWIYPPGPLEPGVKFFVLMLEQIGCRPEFSCEGHPRGFYIVFHGPHPTARAIADCGFFAVSLVSGQTDGYRIDLQGNESGRISAGDPWDEKARDFCLRHVAAAWVERFGPLSKG